MKFDGDLLMYVPFVTMFRDTFDNAIKNNAALFNILLRHLIGTASETIKPCIFAKGENRYEKALGLLKKRYGGKLGVLHVYKLPLLFGHKVRDNIEEFSKISNELCCFKAVIDFYNTDSSYFSEEFVYC